MESLNKHFWDDRTVGLAELHDHLGGAVTPAILWSLAHEQGLKLPTKDYWDFVKLVTINNRHKHLNDYATNYNLPELIQSSPRAVERSVYEVIGKAYRKSNVIRHELRYNPMMRNRSGEQDLDYIITASIRGLERSLLEHPQIKAGIILMLHRTFSMEKNQIILEKAIQYSDESGIIGIDIAGPRTKGFHDYKPFIKLFDKAKKYKLGVTIHVGEEGETTTEMWDVVKTLKPDRIGHGILAYQDSKLMRYLVKNNIILEICPTSNLNTSAVKNVDELKIIIRRLIDNGVKITINTDGAAINITTIKHEMQFLYSNNIMTEPELKIANNNAFDFSFIKK